MRDREAADEAADVIISAFAELHRKLALPYEVWQVLHEMIRREFIGRWEDNMISATDLAHDPDYIEAAEKSGLR